MTKEDLIQEESIYGQEKKSDLEQKLSVGLQGGVELKKGEKNRFLGQFRERVLKVLTFKQVEEAGTYSEVLEAIRDDRATKLIINRQVDMDRAKDYIKLAQQNNLSFKKVNSPDFKGKAALVVVSDSAVHQENIFIQSRMVTLKNKGIAVELIEAKGEKLCNECYDIIKKEAPEELHNYDKFTWIDKLFGKKCPGNHE